MNLLDFALQDTENESICRMREPMTQNIFLHQENTGTAKRVLICEDSPDIAKLLTYMLHHGGIEADVATSLTQARELLAQKSYAALTLDTHLPDGHGVEFLHELYASPLHRSLPVVMVSGTERQELAPELSLPPSLRQWLVKPIRQAQLANAVREAMDSGAKG
jgi:DNA-binding response OmpR family regulator